MQSVNVSGTKAMFQPSHAKVAIYLILSRRDKVVSLLGHQKISICGCTAANSKRRNRKRSNTKQMFERKQEHSPVQTCAEPEIGPIYVLLM